MCCFTSGYGKPEEMFEAWWQCNEGFSQVVRQVWKERLGIQVPWGILKAKIFKSKIACKHWRQVHANPTDRLIMQKLGWVSYRGREIVESGTHQPSSRRSKRF
jgi:hypothetical protein